MSMRALCAGHDLTIKLRDVKAFLTLLRRTILVKDKNGEIAGGVAKSGENQAKGPVIC
jgi:hypothetical protein